MKANSFLSVVIGHLGLANELQKSYSNTGDLFRLKISRSNLVKSLDVLLKMHGWEKRNHFLRPFPEGNVHSRGFLRAWVELHAAADIHHTGRKRMPKPRLRIYGNVEFIEELNNIIAINAGLAPRSVQKTTNKTTKALYYYGSSFLALVAFLLLVRINAVAGIQAGQRAERQAERQVELVMLVVSHHKSVTFRPPRYAPGGAGIAPPIPPVSGGIYVGALFINALS